MTSSVSGQDEAVLPVRDFSPGPTERNFSVFGVLSPIINPLLNKLVWSRWQDIDIVLFLLLYGPPRCIKRTRLISSHLDSAPCQKLVCISQLVRALWLVNLAGPILLYGPHTDGSVGWVSDNHAGTRGFEPWTDQHSGSWNTWRESAAFAISSANGLTFKSSRITTINRRPHITWKCVGHHSTGVVVLEIIF